MLQDPRAAVLVNEFAMRWLQRRRSRRDSAGQAALPGVHGRPAPRLRRGDQALPLAAFCSRTRTCERCLTANYTFLNERLARHYGVSRRRRRAVSPRRARAIRAASGCSAKAPCCCVPRTATARRPCCAGMGARQAHGHPADAAAARRRHEPHAAGRREAEDACARVSSSIASARSARRATASSIPTASRSRTSPPRAAGATATEEADAPIDASTELAGGKSVTGPVELTAALSSGTINSCRRSRRSS